VGEAKRRRQWRQTVEGSLEAMRENLASAVTDVISRHGLEAFEISERATALHEAGHAVAGNSLAGLVPLSLSIGSHVPQASVVDAAADRALGISSKAGLCLQPEGSRFTRSVDVNVTQPEEVIESAAYRLAGQAAEALCDFKNYRWGSSLDEQVEMESILGGLGLFRLGLTQSQCPALILLTRLAVWRMLQSNKAVIERIADALIAERFLDHTTLAGLLQDVRAPQPPIGEWVLSQVRPLLLAQDDDFRAWMQDAAAGKEAKNGDG